MPAFNAPPPSEEEAERASNAYLMSLVGLGSGMFLPIMNLIATFIFFLTNRNHSYFVRWHCTQALLSQLSVLPLNSLALWWSVSIAFGPRTLTNEYIAYLLTALIYNLLEFAATTFAAIRTRRAQHVSWFAFGHLTDALVRQ